MIRNKLKCFDEYKKEYSIQELNDLIPDRKFKKKKRNHFKNPYQQTITPFQKRLTQLPASVLHIIWKFVHMIEYNGLYFLHQGPTIPYLPYVEQMIEKKGWYPTIECSLCKKVTHTRRSRECQLCKERVCSHCWEMVSKSLYEQFKCFFYFQKSKEYVYCTECKDHLTVSCSSKTNRVMDCRRIHHKWGESVFEYWNRSHTTSVFKPYADIDHLMKGVYGSYYFEDKMRLQLHISRAHSVGIFPEYKRYKIEECKKYIDGELFTIRYIFYL